MSFARSLIIYRHKTASASQLLIERRHHFEQGNYDEADKFYERGLRIDEKAFGQNHVSVARDLNKRVTLKLR